MGEERPRIGVLAIQGDFAAHTRALEDAGADAVEVRKPAELAGLDGLVLPGGESTTFLKFLERDGLLESLQRFLSEKPAFGTCAGCILLARNVSHPPQESLAAMEMCIRDRSMRVELSPRISYLSSRGLGREPLDFGDGSAAFSTRIICSLTSANTLGSL